MRIKFKATGKIYTLTFDDYGVLDTISCDGKLMVSTHRVARQIVNNIDKIAKGILPPAFEHA